MSQIELNLNDGHHGVVIEKFLNAIFTEMQDSGKWEIITIEHYDNLPKESALEKQESATEVFEYIYVSQYASGVVSGSYSGNVYFPIGNDKFLNCHFNI